MQSHQRKQLMNFRNHSFSLQILAVPCLFFLICLTLVSCQKATKQPNVLFIFADDQRADALGTYGNPYIQTPAIDQLAREGSQLNRAYVMGGNHGAICMASRAMLFSGKNLFEVYDRLDGVHTMTMDFAKAGYTTFGTGKWHNGKETFEASFQQAENVLLSGMADHYRLLARDYGEDGKLKDGVYEGYSTDLFAQSAIDFIESHTASNPDKPFFCYLALTAPHDPYSPKSDFINYYPDGSLPLPGNYLPHHPFQFDHLTVRDENLTGWPRRPEVIQMILSDYYALITHVDQQVARIIETLKQTGAYENTLIVYAADNGLAAGSHGLLGKQSLYEHSTRIPMIIKGPGVPADREFDAFAYIHDLYPTLAELAGVPVTGTLDGKSLVPVFQGKSDMIREDLFTAYRNTIRALRHGPWKIIRYPERDITQLYDLEKDPLEINNLAEREDFQPIKDSLLRRLEAQQKVWKDTVALTASQLKNPAYDPDTLVRKADQWQPAYTLKRYFELK